MHAVTVSAAIAKTRSDGTGTRRRTIWRGTKREETVELSRQPLYFDELPPEIAADPELIVRTFEPAEPVNETEPEPEGDGSSLAALSYVGLRKLAAELGCSVMGNATTLRRRILRRQAEEAQQAMDEALAAAARSQRSGTVSAEDGSEDLE